ncbi:MULTISPECIES: CaiB/BaiF CoA-transferase family protein [Rhodococcus]|uniref:CaiB/BaiF CoA transferase family protein n=1 Tax=Rhodococcus TaxID=1827 RepID=UPI00193B0D56|nr:MULTISPECIES: CaiB/BaiF CoA-transferase family protein [Rhodococcus]QRI79205.1 CoA transferase [Rhodococcus aetherivorans]QSE62503.1 CoA transferase [Rhodococcus sp. PSBB066]
MGPLHGLRVLELGGRGPVRFSGMLLADLGAEVISIHRPRPADDVTPLGDAGLGRGRRRVSLDLRTPAGRRAALAIASRADAVIEGFLPKVTESLGVGPADCMAANPRLVYGRITGWGQTGPLANQPGHDINFLAVSGVLAHLGRADTLPAPPMNLLADGGGAMLLTLGVTAAVLQARESGVGQVVDASMLEGDALLSTMSHEMRNEGRWVDERGSNLNDSGAPFYDVYPTSDGRLVAVGAVEERYWTALLALLEIGDEGPDRWDRATWPWWRERLGAAFAQRTQTQWCEHSEAAGACVSPVLTGAEAADHPHNRERGIFTRVGDDVLPSPAPRFSRTTLRPLGSTAWGSDQTRQVLAELEIDEMGIFDVPAASGRSGAGAAR